MRYSHKIFGAVLILALASMSVWLPSDMASPVSPSGLRSASGAPGSNQAQQESPSSEVFASEPVTPSVTLPASELPAYVLEYTLDREINPRLSYNAVVDPNFNPPGGPDPLLAVQESAPLAQPNSLGTPLLNFNGQGYTGVNPPDTIGDVGPDHYVQMINGSGGALVQIYNKTTGAPIGSQFSLDGLATSVACRSGMGDPIVLYDDLANRWLLSEFAGSGSHLCVYVSTGSNPGGTYYSYDFTTPTFPDYPKYAVWPDAYYVSSNETDPTAYALNRTRMLSGLSATFQRFTAPKLTGFGFQALIPADLDGATAPPAGAPGLFMRHRDTEVHGPPGYPSQDILETYAFHVDWTTPANSTFTKLSDILTAEFDSTLCGLTSFSCIPQPGTSVKLDPLREVIMWRLSYRNFGSRQVLVGNFTTDVNGNDRAGIRWFELRKIGSGAWTLYQEGTYAPGTTNRWMGGIAMDGYGNIALGYNVSSSSDYPGLRYAGRLASDALGTLSQGEHTLVNGTASSVSNRYGDYSAMSVDPADDCTFWFTGEWNAAGTWSTRIGKFKFDQCGQVNLQPRAYLPLILKSVAQRAVTITHSQSQTVVADNSAACGNPLGTADNAYLRQFTLTSFGITGPFNVTSVRFGIEVAYSFSGGGQPLTVRLYRKIDPAGALTYSNLSQIGTASRTVSDQTLSLYSMPVAGTAPAGSVLVVEVYSPNGQASGNFFFIGSNSAGQTGASFLAAADCGVPEPTSTAALGFPNMHIVMNVTGTTSLGREACVTVGDTGGMTGNTAASTECTVGDDLGADFSTETLPATVRPNAATTDGSPFQWMKQSDIRNE